MNVGKHRRGESSCKRTYQTQQRSQDVYQGWKIRKNIKDRNSVETQALAELIWTIILVPPLSYCETLDKFFNPFEPQLLPPLVNVGTNRIFLKGREHGTRSCPEGT